MARLHQMTGTLNILLAALIGLSACDSDPTAPTEDELRTAVITALGDVSFVATPGTDVVDLPGVQVRKLRHNRPMAGVAVTFTVNDPDGTVRTYELLTDADGVAMLPAWHIGAALGKYQVLATVASRSPVAFSAYVRGRIVRIYDLFSVNGIPASNYPYLRPNNFVLYEDSTWNGIQNTAAEALDPTEIDGTYRIVESSFIDFYIDPFHPLGAPYVYNNYLYVRAGLNGNTIQINETDDYNLPWIMLYVLRS